MGTARWKRCTSRVSFTSISGQTVCVSSSMCRPPTSRQTHCGDIVGYKGVEFAVESFMTPRWDYDDEQLPSGIVTSETKAATAGRSLLVDKAKNFRGDT